MQTIWAAQALVEGTWQRDVRITLEKGRINEVESGAQPEGQRVDFLIPAPVNCHSHAFQRAMAGLTERREASEDSFWTWRALMYRFLDELTPDHVKAIAAFVHMEMLEAGFGASVEFHYLHHRPDGTHYDNIAEMAERIAAAASISGIGLTLLPVQYQFGGCDQRALQGGQRRFGNDPAQFERLVKASGKALSYLPEDTALGVAPHSLRAVAPGQIREAPDLLGSGPVHMHLAEQQAEVDEVRSKFGARPVEWVVGELPLSDRWCMIHCTQMQPRETNALARTGVTAGLCPLTEASLGDGVFDGMRWDSAGGRIALGSDSNILISLTEEARQLDTSQRLRDHSRAAYANTAHSTGRRLLDLACDGGAIAAGRQSGRIEVGAVADLLALDTNHPDLVGLDGDTALDAFVFAGNRHMVRDVWSAGRHLVQEGRHVARDQITQDYVKQVKALRAAC